MTAENENSQGPYRDPQKPARSPAQIAKKCKLKLYEAGIVWDGYVIPWRSVSFLRITSQELHLLPRTGSYIRSNMSELELSTTELDDFREWLTKAFLGGAAVE